MMMLYGAVAVSALWPAYRTKSERRQIGLIWFLVLPPIVFASLWCSGYEVWGISVYWPILGDNYDLHSPAKWTATLFALTFSLIVFVRLALGRAGPRYRVLVLCFSIALAVLYGVVQACWYAEPI